MPSYLEEITPDMTSLVPDGYTGRCAMTLDGGKSGRHIVVFPSVSEATDAAHLALNPTLGGYGEATIAPTTESVTHQTAQDWLLE